MSAVVETFIQCDGHKSGCYESFGVDDRRKTAASHRREFQNNGWVRRGGKDLCPNCKQKQKQKK